MGKQVAVLIDGDNISYKYAEYIKWEAMHYGNVRIFRLYGSISSPSVRPWYKVMPLQGIMPMLQITYANGKSVADQALTIDVMDLLYTQDIDVFCIVSSDSDFTKLVYRLKEAGKVVIGMGEAKTKEALAKACDEFKILDLIYKDADLETQEITQKVTEKIPFVEKEVPQEEEEIIEEEPIEESKISIPSEAEVISYIYDFMKASEDEKINLSEVGKALKEKFLGFDARNYDYNNMTKMLQNHSDRFKVDRQKAPDGIHGIIYVSVK